MKLIHAGLVSLTLISLSSCGKKEDVITKPALPPLAASVAAPMPDVGKVDTMPTKAIGYGATPAAATSDAMKTAILQVNGATIDTGSVQIKYGLDVTDGKDAVSLRATEFAEMVAQKSGGAITNFRIVSVVEPKEKDGLYKVSIEANIAHFTAPTASKKIKVVVAPIHFDVASFVIGTETIPAQKVAEDIRQQVSNALTNTGRFSVLDREIGADIENELNMIKSGEAPRAETGKLGQAVTADVIWAGTINTLAYNRHARQLRSSDRELVSYSGGWGMSQKLVNVATRQVMTSDALQGTAPEVEPTTMGTGINSGQVLQNMESEIANKVVASILARTFPITVVSRDGTTIVLSQGGQSVRAGTRYAMVSMGKEIKDPQTGESLGRMESPCCVVVVDKVTPKLSYGHIENVKIALDSIPAGGLQLREEVKSASANEPAVEPKSVTSTENVPATVKKMAVTSRSSKRISSDESSIQSTKEDGKW
jgi:curli biogenesis system outer membrane secretion channel CsgG